MVDNQKEFLTWLREDNRPVDEYEEKVYEMFTAPEEAEEARRKRAREAAEIYGRVWVAKKGV